MKKFTEVHAEYRPKVERYLARLAGEDNAPDLTQTVFLKVSRGMGELRDKRALSAWIFRIATNVARDHAASSNVPFSEEDETLENLPDEKAVQAEEEYIRREMNSCIRGLVDRLDPKCRTVLLLSEFEGFSNPEIATIVGASLDTVKIRLHRGRVALRSSMECECRLYHDHRSELMCDRKGEV